MTEGDTLVVFSDGVPEARNSDGLPYGYDAPVDLLASLDTANMGAEQIKRAILESVGKCCEHVKQSDDIAMVVIKVVNRENG
jgi:serine phosphatase RsbU (regulator of sigma subunit)